MEKKNKRDLFKLIIICFVIVVFLGCFVTIVGNKESSKNDNNIEMMSNSDTDLIYAYNSCISFVKDKLKSPSSAVFPDTRHKVEHTIYEGSNTYSIESYVESKNSFGVMTRTGFSCTIHFENGSVYCQNLKFD